MTGTGGARLRTGEVMLIGRDAECARLRALIRNAREQRSGTLVLTGDPGIGKSALCAWAMAQAAGIRVLSVRGSESETEIPFAGLSALCAGELSRIGTLPPPQARALEGALARRDAPQADRFAIGAATLSLFAAVADEGPVLVVVDDAQWLDASSADALIFAARRLRREGVAVLAATRPHGVFDAERNNLTRLTVSGLDPLAARTLLQSAHGNLPTAVCEGLVGRTAGNPLALLEIPHVLTDDQRAGRRPIDDPLPVGPALVAALLQRVTGLPDATRRGLLVAAASTTRYVQPVLAALDDLGLDRGTLEPAERAGVVLVHADRLEFHHPLLRSAIYHGAAGPALREAHTALARVSAGDARVWHLARATVGEDETIASALERAGLQARHRGAPAAAAAALEHAARLSAPGSARVRRLTEGARDAHIAGRPAVAVRLLDAALNDSPDVLQRADIQYVRGRILVLQGQIHTAYALLADEAERVRELDPARSAVMFAEACMARFVGADIASAAVAARNAYGAAACAAPDVQAFAGVMLAAALLLNGQRAEAGALLDRFLPHLQAADPLTEAGELVSVAAQCYFWLDRDEVASELLAGLIAAARDASAPAALLVPLCCRADLDLRLGRWTVAAAELDEAAELGDEVSQSVFAAYAHECLARLAAAKGDEVACREHAARTLTLVDAHHNELGRLYLYSALGLLELGLGHVPAAIRQLEDARDLVADHGLVEPNIVHWQADLVEAYVRAGRADDARTSLVEFERQAEATGGRWARGVAARCRGLLADDVAFDEAFASALDHLNAVQSPFEIARTHLCHGERLRRAGRRTDARAALGQAIDVFDQLGARPWSARANAELRASGATRRRRTADARDHLTAHEVQVALLVARGASNREAAASLFLSPKTIEFHLASVYRKLGVRGRTELAALAARHGWLEGI